MPAPYSKSSTPNVNLLNWLSQTMSPAPVNATVEPRLPRPYRSFNAYGGARIELIELVAVLVNHQVVAPISYSVTRIPCRTEAALSKYQVVSTS